jgi:tripartite-type tricarboxylate transporter receptor subunit TctC
MYSRRRNLVKAFFIVASLITNLLAGDGLAQEPYPNRPITVIDPWGPGMSNTIARFVCKAAEKELGQAMIIESKPGAGGSIAMNYILKARPDGYTLGTPMTSAYIIHPHLRQVQYNPFDSVDITTIFKYPIGLAVRIDAPWKTFEEILAYARKNPGKFTYSTAGVGVVQHIVMEQIAMQETIKWTQIPFKSGGEAVAACLGGHTDAVAQGPVDELPHLNAGKLKLLLTLGDSRWPDYPDIPNILEKGFNFYSMSYMCLNAPKGVPESIIKRLEAAFNKAKKDPFFLKKLEEFHVPVSNLNGKEYSDLWRSKYDEMGRIIKALGLQEK